jgi:glycerophosphoryl diester phosphodiesterase
MQAFVKKPLIIAHRGSSALAPENTFAAFRQAIEDGADGIEFDVRLAKDNVPVVIHDSKLKRLGRCEGQVADYTSLELQKLDVGSWFNEKNPRRADDRFSAETVPTLARMFEFLSDYKGLLYVELKCEEAETGALVEVVCQAIRQTRLLSQIIVKSFNLEAVYRTRQLLPEVCTAALFAPKILTILHKKKRLLKKAQECKADEISIHYSLATRKFMQRANKKEIPVTIWTADNPAWVRRALNVGINAIITNNPARLLARRDEILRGNSIVG